MPAPNPTTVLFDRPPATPDELWESVRILWGVQLPRTPICDGHTSPFDAFCEGYFGNTGNYSLWYGSRGTGKSLMLAILGLTKTALLGINATLLGGSMAQSKNVHEHVENLMRAPYAPRHAVDKQIQTELSYKEGNWIRPLPASQRTVRGPHPQLVLLDEIDEMDYDVYTAAQGQAMAKPNTRGVVIPEMTIASSTWQNPVGCLILGTPIATPNGDKPIEQIVPGDLVMTRHGWKPVLHSWDMGMQPTVTVEFASGRTLTCTPWHPIWTDSHSWVRADSLTPGAVACLLRPITVPATQMPATTLAEPFSSVPVDTELPGLTVVPAHPGSPLVVGSGVHQVQMGGIDARLHPAGVVQHHEVRDRANNLLVHPAVSQVSTLTTGPVVLHPIPGIVDTQRPDHTVVGVEVDGYTFEADHVVAVHTGMVRATWDLTVQGTHEYVANGILTHNTFKTVMDNAHRNGLSVHTWCVDGEALVQTANGTVALKDVQPGSSVLTRTGWYEVQHNTFMGIKPAVKVTFANGTELRMTPDHRVATASGWTEAGSLALGTLVFTATLPTNAMPPVGPDPHVCGVGHVVPTPTSGSAGLVDPGAPGVLPLRNDLQVVDVDAPLVATQVVERESIRDHALVESPHDAVSVGTGPAAIDVHGAQAVPGSRGKGPDNTFGHWESQLFDPSTNPASNFVGTTHVVSIETIPAIPVYDIGVEHAHEFTANGIVVHNCWRETAKPHGWLDPAFIERKRLSVPAEMFRVEYELGEPAGDSRAFDLMKLNEAFIDMTPVDESHRGEDDEWVFEHPQPGAMYAAGVDWAKNVDKTVMVVVRIDEHPYRMVYVRRINRRSWPYMIDEFNTLVTRYQAVSAHDATGLGNVVHDMVDERTLKVVMMGTDRVRLLTEYITAVEQGKYRLPRTVKVLYDAHRGTTVDEVFAPGKWNSHLADEVAACAIAHRAATRSPAAASGQLILRSKDDEPLLGWQKHVNGVRGGGDQLVAREGDVVEVVERSDVGVFWL